MEKLSNHSEANNMLIVNWKAAGHAKVRNFQKWRAIFLIIFDSCFVIAIGSHFIGYTRIHNPFVKKETS